jgi:DNA-binding PadR family transcriptional regulator
MITTAQFYILFNLRQKPLSMEDIIKKMQKSRPQAFGTSSQIIYHHVSLLHEKRLVTIEKSHTMPARSTVSISETGKQAISDFLRLFAIEKSIDTKTIIDEKVITEELEDILITEMLEKTYQTVTKSELVRIEISIKEILKIINKAI